MYCSASATLSIRSSWRIAVMLRGCNAGDSLRDTLCRRNAVSIRHGQCREHEREVDHYLPFDRRLRHMRRIDEGLEQMDRRDADQGHGQLDLEHAGVDVGEPFGLVRVVLQIQAGYEGFVASDDHH